jgi:biopolymer transport protein ExbD
MNFKPTQHARSLPVVQMTALIDILFVILSFFMALFLNFNFESELNISVPQAKASMESKMAAEEIVINVGKEGRVVVNQKTMSIEELESLLKKTAELYPGQAVILRADQKAYHEYVVRVLDACAKAKIWNVSFATTKE